ncbi:putative RNA-directed DNA polymerase [Helianthus debilis subsp. tardiflorus]
MDYFFETGSIDYSCSSSFITLIPKTNDPTGLKDYRPINLIGIISKVISKILANRMKKVIGSVISESQSAFVKGRYTLDSPMILSEMWSWLRKAGKCAFIFKIDFEKAYDNVNWEFLLDVLRQMGFPSEWCRWVKGVLMSACSSVLVNGSPTFEFRCQKGLRQGDPLSPFLFLVVMEALSCMVNKACSVGRFKGVKLPNGGPTVSNLLYADDALILGEWEEGNILTVARMLRVFYACSGLKINIHKSNMFGVGVDDGAIDYMAALVGCKRGAFPFKYLGIPLGANMNRIRNWDPIFSIVKSRLASWKAKTLSIGGRLVLIKAVLESLPIYFLSIFKAPVKVINSLESIIRNFLWGGSEDIKKLHWVAWEKVTLPKRYGGLGLSKLNLVNEALLCKWVWRYRVEEESLWRRVIMACHGKARRWSYFPCNTVLTGVWKNIVKTEAKVVLKGKRINNFFKGTVGNGHCIRFWIDLWVGNEPLMFVFPNLFALEKVKSCVVKDRISVPGESPQLCWDWVRPPESEEELAELSLCSTIVEGVHRNKDRDKWRWVPDPSGLYSPQSFKQTCFEPPASGSAFSAKGCKWVPSKVNIFLWRAMLERIPTKNALIKRNIQVGSDQCGLCGEEPESVDHIFTACRVSHSVWSGFCRWVRLPMFFAFSLADILDLSKNVNGDKAYKDIVRGLVSVTCWCIWKARNAKIFSDGKGSSEEIIGEAKVLSFLWLKNRSSHCNLVWRDWHSFPMYML